MLCFLSAKWSKPEVSACSWQPVLLRLLTARWVLSLMFDIVWLFPLLSSLPPSFLQSHPHVPASLKGRSLPKRMHLSPHLLYAATRIKRNTIAFTHTHTGDARSHSQSRHNSMCPHSNTCPDGNEVKAKKQQADFRLVRGEAGHFLTCLSLHIIRWKSTLEGREQLSLAL